MEERPKIDRNITINELVLNYPEAVGVLMSHGFHCIGCEISGYESLADGAAIHGFGEDEVDGIISQIKKAVAEADEFEKKAQQKRKKASEQAGRKARNAGTASGGIEAADSQPD